MTSLLSFNFFLIPNQSTPMTQACHACLGAPSSDQESVSMLYGSKVSTDILGKDMLDAWEKQCGGRFSVTHVLSDEPEDSDWKGERGFITKDLIKKHMPGPDEDNIILFICGPPPM